MLPGSTPTVIEDITFHGEKTVVHLPDDTNADAIDLRSPSGELLQTASIGRQSSITFSLYKNPITPYPPGTYTLVAVETSDGSEPQTLGKHSLELTSSFSVVDVRPIKAPGSGPPPFDGKVQMTIENTGTLPVKIDYIGFPNGVPSPNPPPSETPQNGSNYVAMSETGHIVPVGGQATFESRFAPLWTRGGMSEEGAVGVPQEGASWQHVKRTHCNGERHPATLVVVPGQGPTHRLSVTFKYAGTAARMGSYGTDYGCTNVTVVSTAPKDSSTTTSQ
jgi:hypothetical protein